MDVLDKFQHEAIAFLNAASGRCIYADPMGARKTGTTLTWLAQSPARRTLLVVPKVVFGHWQREAARFAPEHRVMVGAGSAKDRELARLHTTEISGPTIYLTSYGALTRDSLSGFDTVVFDEGHRLKGRTTQVAKSANKVTAAAKQIVCATGTPALNHPHEMWQYLHMIDRRKYSAFWTWAESHFVITHKQHKRNGPMVRHIGDFLPGHEEILRNELIGILLQRELHDIFDEAEHPWIAEPQYVPIEVELSPKERAFYNQLVKHSWGKTPTGLVTATNRAVVNTRLEQITSDWGGLDDEFENGSKVSATVALVHEDLARREPVVIFAKYKATVHRLFNALWEKGHSVVALTGDNEKLHDDLVQDYKDGKVDIVVGTYGSMREGLDGLQFRSAQMVLLDLDWVPGLNEQAIGRLRRSGQRGVVTVYVVFANGTVDATKYEGNLRKVNLARRLKGQDISNIIYGRPVFEDMGDDDEIEIADE